MQEPEITPALYLSSVVEVYAEFDNVKILLSAVDPTALFLYLESLVATEVIEVHVDPTRYSQITATEEDEFTVNLMSLLPFRSPLQNTRLRGGADVTGELETVNVIVPVSVHDPAVAVTV